MGIHWEVAEEVGFYWRPQRVQDVIAYALGQMYGGMKIRSLRAYIGKLLAQKAYLGKDEIHQLAVRDNLTAFTSIVEQMKRGGHASFRGRRRDDADR